MAAYTLLGLMLAIAAAVDLRTRRIPNPLVLAGAGSGAVLATLNGGLVGLGWGLAGLATGFAFFIAFYAAGVMGAGDVKLVAAVGVFAGPVDVLIAAFLTVVAGGVIGLMVLFWHQGVLNTLRQFGLAVVHFVGTRQWLGFSEKDGSGKPLRMPYAIAIAIGCASLAWRRPDAFVPGLV